MDHLAQVSASVKHVIIKPKQNLCSFLNDLFTLVYYKDKDKDISVLRCMNSSV